MFRQLPAPDMTSRVELRSARFQTGREARDIRTATQPTHVVGGFAIPVSIGEKANVSVGGAYPITLA
jgi:hypothetical protein